MRYAVVGAGAIGGYYGGLLSQVADVTFIARGATLESLRTRGLILRSDAGEQLLPVRATDDATQIGPVDLVIITTKARDLRVALGSVIPLLRQGASVMPVQNSVEAPHIAAEFTAPARVIPCVVRGFLEQVAPAVVTYHGGPRSFTFGPWTAEADSLVGRVAADITTAGFDAVVHPDIWVDVWRKAMFVGPFGALGALTDQPLGILRGPLRTEFERAVYEVWQVATALGVAMPDDEVAATLAFADAMPAGATTSMQRDILAGLPSELDAQVGGIVRLAERVGVDVPLLTLFAHVLSLRPGQENPAAG